MDNNFEGGLIEIINRLGRGGLYMAGAWTAAKLAEQLWKELGKRSENFIHRGVIGTFGPCEDIKDNFADLFLGTREKVSIIPAQDNPNVKPDHKRLPTDPFEIFTHTTLAAARSFADVLDQVDDRIMRVDELAALNGEGNLITFGSPTSNVIARAALRYAEIGNGTFGSEHFASEAMDLKILYELNGEKISKSDSIHRFCYRRVNNNDTQIPNWGIRKSNGAVLLPETRNGMLVQDYLVISSLPNIFNRTSLDAGHRIINFGGTHREGTQAVERLFKDERILKELCQNLTKAKGTSSVDPYWQALILVDCDPAKGKISLSKVIDFQKVEVHFSALEEQVSRNHKLLKSYKL